MRTAGRPREFNEEEVLEKGIQFFRIHGYERGGLSALLKFTGLARQSLYNTYGDKQGFFHACIRKYRREWGEKIFEKMYEENATLLNVEETLLDLVRLLSQERDDNCLLVKSTLDLGSAEKVVMEEMTAHLHSLKKQLLDIYEQEGIGKNKQRLTLTEAISLTMTLIMGLHIMAKAQVDRKKMEDAVNALMKTLKSQN